MLKNNLFDIVEPVRLASTIKNRQPCDTERNRETVRSRRSHVPRGEDRRVRRTRRILVEALIGLVLEKGYERITVQEILDRADVGRSTFYAHFRDKEALLLSCFDGLREDLDRELDAMTPGDGPPGLGRLPAAIFAHAYQRQPAYRALCGRQGGNVVSGHLHALVVDVLGAELAPHLAVSGGQIPGTVIAEFYASALLGMLTWWVSQDFPHGPGQMAQMYGAMATPGILAVAGG
jgi:AcrR family transcriptional regulator